MVSVIECVLPIVIRLTLALPKPDNFPQATSEKIIATFPKT